MASQISAEELAEMERLSQNYNPGFEGPLVGPKKSTHSLVEEYAQADRTYISKTQALQSRYSHYRILRGDGICGWRAVAFGYFEALIRMPWMIPSEMDRLKAFSDTMKAMGVGMTYVEDFVDQSMELFQQLNSNPQGQDLEAIVFAGFNDEGMAGGITMHFRIMTSTYMKLNADQYAGFVIDKTIEDYCATHIDPFQAEIEHLSLRVLIDAVINPASIPVEVLYLDRSDVELTPIRMQEFVSNTVIRLLYRPGHYDLLYKAEDSFPLEPPELNPSIHLINPPQPFTAAETSLDPGPAFDSSDYPLDPTVWFDLPGASFFQGSQSNIMLPPSLYSDKAHAPIYEQHGLPSPSANAFHAPTQETSTPPRPDLFSPPVTAGYPTEFYSAQPSLPPTGQQLYQSPPPLQSARQNLPELMWRPNEHQIVLDRIGHPDSSRTASGQAKLPREKKECESHPKHVYFQPELYVPKEPKSPQRYHEPPNEEESAHDKKYPKYRKVSKKEED